MNGSLNTASSRLADGYSNSSLSPAWSCWPASSVSSTTVRFMFLTGLTQRSISSMADPRRLRSASSVSQRSRSSSSWYAPPLMTWRVVSSPPMRISIDSYWSSASVRLCPSTSAPIRVLMRSSVGDSRRAATTLEAYSKYPAAAAICASRERWIARPQRAHQVVAPGQQLLAVGRRDPEQIADGDQRQPCGNVADEVEFAAFGDRLDQRTGGAADRRFLLAYAARREALVDDLAPLEVRRIVRVDHARHRRVVGTDAVGAAERLRVDRDVLHQVVRRRPPTACCAGPTTPGRSYAAT